jgi:hypothetical protein
LIPRYIGIVKAIALGAATLALIALALALFKGLFEVKTTATLFASLLLPVWIVDQAERKFGRWIVPVMAEQSMSMEMAAKAIGADGPVSLLSAQRNPKRPFAHGPHQVLMPTTADQKTPRAIASGDLEYQHPAEQK